jgi:hypothetical protein
MAKKPKKTAKRRPQHGLPRKALPLALVLLLSTSVAHGADDNINFWGSITGFGYPTPADFDISGEWNPVTEAFDSLTVMTGCTGQTVDVTTSYDPETGYLSLSGGATGGSCPTLAFTFGAGVNLIANGPCDPYCAGAALASVVDPPVASAVAVGEPAMWLLLLSGLALVTAGWLVRSRRFARTAST